MKLKITLNYKNKTTKEIEVETDKVKDTSIVVYKGVYFTYGGMAGRFYTEIRFNEVSAPVVIEDEHPSYVTTTTGMRGMFPVMMAWNDDGFYEPYATGETCKTHKECVAAAKVWAECEGIEYRP